MNRNTKAPVTIRGQYWTPSVGSRIAAPAALSRHGRPTNTTAPVITRGWKIDTGHRLRSTSRIAPPAALSSTSELGEIAKFMLVSGSELGMKSRSFDCAAVSHPRNSHSAQDDKSYKAAKLRSACTGEDARAYIIYAACPFAPTGES